MIWEMAPDLGLKVRGTRNRVGGSYFGLPSASNLASRTWKAGGSSFQLILVFWLLRYNSGDKVTGSVKPARNRRADIDGNGSLLLCPQFKLPDPGFRMTCQTIGAVPLTEEAQHGKSPDSGAEDGNNLKSKFY